MRVYIGYDEREHEAASVAAKTLREVTRGQIEPEFLCVPKLRDQGLLNRPAFDNFDIISNESVSTAFKFSRFLVPIICQQGYGLFVDCDVVFLRDPREMMREVEARHAVSVVPHINAAQPNETKMMGREQKHYPRKWWSSVMLFNCDHPANRRLSLRDVNERAARDLHAFYWLETETEIGVLDDAWNWLVDVEPRPPNLGIAHMTLGGPWIDGWHGQGAFDSGWMSAHDGGIL